MSPPFDALFHLSLLTSLDLSKCQLATLHTLQFVSQVRVWVRSMGPVLSIRQGACRSMLCCVATNLLCPCASPLCPPVAGCFVFVMWAPLVTWWVS